MHTQVDVKVSTAFVAIDFTNTAISATSQAMYKYIAIASE